MLNPSRMVALGDVHLTRSTPRNVSDDLARLVEAHPGARIVIAGDLFDLSADLPKQPIERAIDEVFGIHTNAKAALGRHLIEGGQLWLVSGNHDAALGFSDFRNALEQALDLPQEARSRLRTTPWFFREGFLHIEHGHLFDPDNAPTHPLIMGEPSLGVHFVEQFIAPTGAYRYFHAAILAIVRSGPGFKRRSKMHEPLAEEEFARFTEALGISPDLARTLLGLGARPTLESVSRTFSRLYFDRVLSTIAMTAGLSAVALGKKRAGATVFSLGALAMASSWSRGHNRYGGTTAEQLAGGAQRIVDATDARLVIVGHTHREALGENYANTASFAFPRGAPGRPYLEIDAHPEKPRAIRHYWPMTT